MKVILFFSFLIIAFSCKQQEVTNLNYVLKNAVDYFKDKKGFTGLDKDEVGNYYFKYDSSLVILRKRQIYFGKLDGDTLIDAIASYSVIRNNKLFYTGHLLWINKENEMLLANDIRKEILINRIENNLVYAEQSLISSDSPNYGCNECKEKIKLKLIRDSLEILENKGW